MLREFWNWYINWPEIETPRWLEVASRTVVFICCALSTAIIIFWLLK
jgi:hypothetical protein